MSVSAVSPVSAFSPLSVLGTTASAIKAKAQATSGTTSGSGLTGTSVGSTFLNLLVKELQNQDPTAPMDSTAMVGQMISLNQLDQLISINQTLGTATSSSSTSATKSSSTAHGTPSSAMSSADLIAQQAKLLNTGSNTSSAQAAALAAADPTSTLNLSNLNLPYGAN